MPFVAMLGCDGSGKSAVIRQVTDDFRAAGIKVTPGHWRPAAFPAKSAGNSSSAEDPHGRPPRGALASILKLVWLWLNWWIGWWNGLHAASRKGLVLFDRFHGDIVVDPRRYRYGGPMWLAKLACRLMPQPDLILFLDAPPEVLLSRKQEVGMEDLASSRAGYLKFGETSTAFQRIDADQPLPRVVEEVLRRIHEVFWRLS